eukprot:4102969-Amphidinium_carterae.1
MARYGTIAEQDRATVNLREASKAMGIPPKYVNQSKGRGTHSSSFISRHKIRKQDALPAVDDEDERPLDTLLHTAKPDTGDDDVRLTAISGTPVQLRKVLVAGTATFPLKWSDAQIAAHLAGLFAVSKEEVKTATTCKKKTPTKFFCVQGATFPCTFVQGGGKYHRVQQHSLEFVVVDKLSQDLTHCSSIGIIEKRLLEHLAHADARFVRCAFQANSTLQRLAALAAAMERAGMTDQSKGIRIAMQNYKESVTGDQVGQTTSGGEETTGPQLAATGPAVDSTVEQLNLDKRLRAIELWAHALDAIDEGRPTALPDVLCRLIEQKVAETLSKPVVSDDEVTVKAAAKLLTTVLPLSRQGMMIEHDVVQQILRQNLVAAKAVLEAGTLEQQYREFGLALRSAGYDALAKGLFNAKITCAAAKPDDVKDSRQHDSALDESGGPTSEDSNKVQTDPYMTQLKRKRGRPPSGAKSNQLAVAGSQRTNDSGSSQVVTGQQISDIMREIDMLKRQVSSTKEETGSIQQYKSTYSQETIDYDAVDKKRISWDDKIDHMDAYLAELGGCNLRIMDDIKQLKSILGLETSGQYDAANAETPVRTHVIQKYEAKLANLEQQIKRVAASGGSEASDPTQIRLERLIAEVGNLSKLLQFSWTCTQNLAM